MCKKDKNPPSPILGNTRILAGITIIIVILAIIAILLATGNAATGSAGGSATVPPDECGAAVMVYANANLISKESPATLVSVTDRNGMYQIHPVAKGRKYPVFLSGYSRPTDKK